MNKIVIPFNADCFCSNHGKLNFHVAIEDEALFAAFCKKNNIGYYEGARTDVVMSSGHVFTPYKDVFENFPSKVDLLM